VKFNKLRKKGQAPNILGFTPSSKFDKDRYAKNFGYKNHAELVSTGNQNHIDSVGSAEAAFNKSKNEIVPWMESHVATADAVNDLVDAVNVLEVRINELNGRLAALEAQANQ
jgi:hypothetical protein